MQKLLSTTEFARALGVSESTVRRLADRGELEIHRTQGGHRKIPVAEAIRYSRETNTKLVRPEILGLLPGGDLRSADVQDRTEPLLAALRAGDAATAIAIGELMYADGSSMAEICDGPLRTAMDAIGNAWPQDKRSIFVEHRATILCVRVLCQLRTALRDPEHDAPTALGAAPQDDFYLLPCLMASLVLHEAGFNETNLGPNTPLDILTDSVEEESPAVVWLAITNPIRSRRHHREIEQIATLVDAYHGKFLVGGQGATTYQGPAQRCNSMSELRLFVTSH